MNEMMKGPSYFPVTPPAGHDEQEIDIAALLGVLLKDWRIVAAATAAALMLAVIYVICATPVFKVDAMVQVEDQSGGALGAAVKDLGGLFEGKSLAVTEIPIIKSRMVLGGVVDELGLQNVVEPVYFPVLGKMLARHEVLTALESVPGLDAYSWSQKNSVKISGLSVPEGGLEKPLTLLVSGKSTFRLMDGDGNFIGAGKVGQRQIFESEAGKLGLVVQDIRAPAGTRFLIDKLPRSAAIAALDMSLEVSEVGRQSGILKLTMIGTDPDSVAHQLDSIAKSYVRQNTERKAVEAEQTLKYLDKELPDSKRQLDEVEARFNAYRSRYGVANVDQAGQILQEEAAKAESSLVEMRQKREELLQRFTPEHPSVKALDKSIEVLQQQRKQFEGRLGQLPKTEQEMLRLTRDLRVQQEIYTGMLNNAQQLRVVRGGTVGNVRVIDYAQVPLDPIRPQKALILALAMVLGAMLGVAIVFLRQALRTGVKDSHKLESAIGLPVYATIPLSRRQQELKGLANGPALLAQQDDQDLAIESMRSLRTALHFASFDSSNNVILMCGPAPGIGKSFLTANLAAVIAASGERVVVVDADMRRGTLHEYFGGGRGSGLSNILSGQQALEDVIRHSHTPGLAFIASGVIPPNPSELLLHENFTRLVKALSERYDRVLIDCPPILAVTDAAIVGRHAGAVLMVARYAQTPLAQINDCVNRLRNSGVAVSGIVMNCVERADGYGYGYAYNYSYRSETVA